MKKFVLFLVLFYSQLLANGSPLILSSYSTNKIIDMQHIADYTSKFKTEIKENKYEIEILWGSDEPSSIKQDNTHQYNWIMIQLDKNLSSGTYWIEHISFDFDKHSFKPNQNLENFYFLGRKFFSFHYDKTKDEQRYFLKVVPSKSHIIPSASLYTPQKLSVWIDRYSLQMLISFFLYGLIFMTAIYNGAIYIYNREKSFLYYMLMQFFMIVVLIYQTDIIETYIMGSIENEKIAIFFYFIFVESTILFILLFVRSFLGTKEHLPSHDKVLHYITIVAIVDFIIFFMPIMLMFRLYTFIILYIVWIAWLRLKQGYRPALFFLFGWFALMLGVFLSEYFPDNFFSFEPMIIGSTIEALFLSIAISYKMREIKNEKEEQQEMLVHQSKLASMGDMLGNIAHQWRQPLTRLGFILMNIEQKDREKHHERKLEEASNQLEFMSQTIDDFRNFYAPSKAKELFSLAKESRKIIDLTSFNKIELEINVAREIEIMNYKNEYKQVLLNLLTNAKDVLTEREIVLPKIMIEIDGSLVKVSDNAGGVSSENIQKIFEPYFSTKEGGLGIGLYMSKMIVEKNMGGTISVSNSKEGAIFRLDFR